MLNSIRSKPGSFPPLSVSSNLPIPPLSARSRQLVLSLKFRERSTRLQVDPNQVPAVPWQGGRGELRPVAGRAGPTPEQPQAARARRVSTPSPVCASIHPAAVCPRPWRSCWCSPSGTGAGILQGSPVFICELGCSPSLYCLSYPLARPGSLPPHPPLPSWLQALENQKVSAGCTSQSDFINMQNFPQPPDHPCLRPGREVIVTALWCEWPVVVTHQLIFHKYWCILATDSLLRFAAK